GMLERRALQIITIDEYQIGVSQRWELAAIVDAPISLCGSAAREGAHGKWGGGGGRPQHPATFLNVGGRVLSGGPPGQRRNRTVSPPSSSAGSRRRRTGCAARSAIEKTRGTTRCR